MKFVTNSLRRSGPAGLAMVLTTLLTVGCQTTGQGAVSGAAIGALGGLAIGSISGDAGQGAAIGAIGGAIAGGVIGNQNEQAAERQREMRYGHGY